MVPTRRNWLSVTLMGAVAVAIPAIIMGRSVVGIALAVALLTVPFLDRRGESWRLAYGVFTSRAAALVALVAAAWLPSLLESSDPMKSFEAYVRTFVYFAGGVIVWAALRVERADQDVAYRVLLAMTIVLCGIGFMGMFISDEFLQMVRGHGWIQYSAQRSLKESASSAAILLPIVVLAGYRLYGGWRVLAFVTVIELLLLIYYTANRSALAGLLCATVIVVVLVATRTNHLRRLVGVLAAGLMLLAFVGWSLQQYQYPPQSYPGVQLTPIPYWLIDPPRQAIWLNVWEAGEPYRLFGAGINVIDQLPGAGEWNATTGTENIPLHPHDWVLEIIVETGFVGFGAMLAALAYITSLLVREYLRSGDRGVLAANAVWFAYWTIGLFNVSFWSSWWQVSFVAAMAICLAFRDSRAIQPTAEAN